MLGIGHLDLGDGDGGAVRWDPGRHGSPAEGLGSKFANRIPLLTLSASADPFVGCPPALDALVRSRDAGHGPRLGERADLNPFFSHLVSRVRFPTVPCPSGRRSMSRKHVWVQVHRGFKSHRHRQTEKPRAIGAFLCIGGSSGLFRDWFLGHGLFHGDYLGGSLRDHRGVGRFYFWPRFRSRS